MTSDEVLTALRCCASDNCNGLQLHLAMQRHAEPEDMLAGLLCQLFAVRIQGDGVLVGVDLDLDLALGAVSESKPRCVSWTQR